MLCAKCGKETKEFYDNLCLDCYLKKLKPIKVEIRKCKICGKYFISNKVFSNMEELLNFYIRKFYSKKINIPLEKISREHFETCVNDFLCRKCNKRISRKVEAILQLRGNKDCVEEIISDFELFTKRVEYGYDVFFSSKEILKKIREEIKRKYTFEEKISRKLVGVKDGKRKYKDTILIRIYGKKR